MKSILRAIRTKARACLGLVCLLAVACAPDRPANPLQEVKGLSREMVDHLVQDSEAEFTEYCRASGNLILRNAVAKLNAYRREALDLGIQEYARRDSLVTPHYRRLVRCLASEYGLNDYAHIAQQWLPLSPARKMELERISQIVLAAGWDQSLPPSDRERVLLEILARVEELQPSISVAVIAGFLADLAIADGRPGDLRHYLDLAIADARKYEKYLMLTQLLGKLGSVHHMAGRPDSMRICYDEALAVALEHRLPEMAGRIHQFYASLYLQEGRPGLAKHHFDRAIEVCREFKGGYLELRFLLAITEFHAEAGCWDLVGRHLDRAQILERQYGRCPVSVQVEAKSRELARRRARWLMAVGWESAGDSLYAELAASDWSTQKRTERVRLYRGWGEDLVRSGREEEAIPVLDQSIRFCRSGNMPEEEPRLWVLLAGARLACGDVSACREALTSFRKLAGNLTLALPEEWLLHDQLTIEAALAEGEPERAVAAVRAALARLQEFLTGLDASNESFLVLGQAERLRHLLAQIAQANPDVGYAVELLWRGALAESRAAGSRTARPLESCADLLAWHLAPGEREAPLPDPLRDHLDLLQEMNATHLCYRVGGEQVIRWVVQEGRIDCLALDHSAAEIASLVEAARSRLSLDPGGFDAPLPTGLGDQLRELGKILLPTSLTGEKERLQGEKPLLLVTASGCLTDFPFAVLGAPGRRLYRPLLVDHDLAFLQAPLCRAGEAPAGPGLVVADPILSPEVSRWVGPLPALTFGQQEAGLAQTLVPNVRVLRRTDATKEALLAHWADAPFIYFAAHTLRDPEEPYLSFIPLSVSRPGLPLEAGLLDAADIRAARFDGCRLVVLSGCSSGLAFRGQGAEVPGLGSAFSAAGADCVVQTLWDIRDEDAGRIMDPFLRAWAEEGFEPVRALNQALRRGLILDPDRRHPFSWGAYAALIRTSPSPGLGQ